MNWSERYALWKRQRDRAIELGLPIPGTGHWGWHRRHRKMRPYQRPRKGGGTSKRNEYP